MEDYDCIEAAYIFEEELSVNDYRSLFKRLVEYAGGDEELEFSLTADVDKATPKESAEIMQANESGRVKPPSGLDISILFDKQGLGLLSEPWVPHLNFTTWIYRLKGTNDGEISAEVKRLRREFAEIHALAADNLEPRWVFGRRGGLAIGEDESIEELTETTTPPLYEYNYFRPETVDALGWDRVLTAPAWYVDKLDSGGVFLAVREPPKQCSPGVDACLEVADHLGISLGKPERYH